MKRILKYAAALSVSLMAAAFSSCEKETADDSETAEKGKITVSFDSASLYEELGIAQGVSEKLSSGEEFVITDSVLVYDQAGTLVAKSGVESRRMGKQSLELEGLDQGSYTLVLWQTQYNQQANYAAWKLTGETSLSTVNIITEAVYFGYGWALGYASTPVTLADKDLDVTITPKAAGCITDITVDGISEHPEYTNISLVGGGYCTGVYLDPSRPKENRWIVDTNYSGIICGVTPEEGGQAKIFTLTHGEDIDLTFLGDKADGSDVLCTHPHKSVVAGEHYTVYLDLDRLGWQPPFFGSAEDFAPWKADRDAGLLVFDPCMDWGCDLSRVEEHIQSKNWWKEGGGKLEASDIRWRTHFQVADSLYEYYYFKTEDGKDLDQAICYCANPAVPIQAAYLLVQHQGFSYVGQLVLPG